jgi:hypothetical protein
MARPKKETQVNGTGSEILALVPTADALRVRIQYMRDEVARAEALLECVERMTGAGPAPSFTQLIPDLEGAAADADE